MTTHRLRCHPALCLPALALIACLSCACLAGCQAAPIGDKPANDVIALRGSEQGSDLQDSPQPEPAQQDAPEMPAASPSQQNGAFDTQAIIAAGEAIEARIAAGDATAKICYLTLDDGPSENTMDILSTLQQKGVPATWFIQGNSAQIDLVKNIFDAGHGLALHTFSHDYASLYASQSAYFADLDAVREAVYARTGQSCDVVRFPGGTSNMVSASYCKGIMSALTTSVPAAGYQYFDWNVSGGDSSSPPPPVSDITANVLDNTGGMQRICVLVHDTTAKRTTTDALAGIIDGLREQGYEFGIITHDTKPFQHQAGN